MGEISYALEKVFGRHRADSSVVSGAYSTAVGEGGDEEMEKVRELVAHFADAEGRNPRILVAKVRTISCRLICNVIDTTEGAP